MRIWECIRSPSGPLSRSPAAGSVLNPVFSICRRFPAGQPRWERTARSSTCSRLTAPVLIAVSGSPISTPLRVSKARSAMRKFAIAALILTGLTAAPREVSFSTADGGVVWADVYGAGERGVVLAHGARFDKASWAKQAEVMANTGFRVLAIDFRGYG